MPRRPVKRKNTRNLKRKTSRYPKKRVNTGNLKRRNLQPYVETKSAEASALTQYMDVTSATNVKPQATTVIVPGCWSEGLHQGFASNQFIGQDVFDRYLSQKMLINFADVPPQSTTAGPIANIRYVQGWCKRKQSASVIASSYNFTDYQAIVEKAMVDCNFGSNFLSYSEKWKDLKIIKTGYLRPKNLNKNFNPTEFASEELQSHEPMKMKFNWTIQRKNRLYPSGTGTSYLRADSWIPFVCFYSSTLHGQEEDEVPSITHISKIWYSDS